MESPVGTTSYTYNTTTGRLSKITSPQSKEFNFNYSNGQLSNIQRPNGVTTHYSFDNVGNLTLLNHHLSGSTLRSYGYTYDKNGMRESMTDTNGVHDYTYDAIYQITQATHPTMPTENFSYDSVGNWQGFGRIHNELNQLTEDSSYTYEYDADGNMTLKVDKNTGDTTQFVWNIENKLTKVYKPNGDSIEFVYGPLGRRLAKIVNDVRAEYRYDGEDLIIEMDNSDSILASYTFGPGIDQPMQMHRNDKNYYYLADGLGSVTGITDSTGTVLQEYLYSVFGEIDSIIGDSIDNPFTYTAREWDGELDLYFYRNRYYDPVIGRFISQDPIGFLAGDVNLYRYVSNSPLNFTDPYGFCRQKGEAFLSCLNRHAKDFYGGWLTAADAVGYYGIGSSVVALGSAGVAAIGEKIAQNAIDDAILAGPLAGGSILDAKAAIHRTGNAASRLTFLKGTLTTISNVTGVVGAFATGFSIGARAAFIGDCMAPCDDEPCE